MSTRSLQKLLFLALSGVLAAGCQDKAHAPVHQGAPAGAVASPARGTLGADGNLSPHPDDRCPVCAMKPHKNPKFASAIEHADGRVWYFCGTGCMIRSWLHPEIFLGVEPGTLKRSVVPGYFDGKPVDGAKARWVAGSDVVGPMGPALVPLATETEAAAFVKRHGGNHRFRLGELNDERWQEITGKPAARKGHHGGGQAP